MSTLHESTQPREEYRNVKIRAETWELLNKLCALRQLRTGERAVKLDIFQEMIEDGVKDELRQQ